MKRTDNREEKSGNNIFYRRQLEEVNLALAESESSYRSIFEHATDAIYIQDEKGIFLDVNPAATRMYGYKREEMIGSTPEKLAAPGKNDLKKTMEHVLKAFNGEPQTFEWWGKRKNGEEFPKEIVLNRGMYYGREVVFAMARDITERVNALEALKESEDKFKSLANQIPLGMYRTKTDGQLVYANPTLVKILGYNSVKELIKQNVRHLYANPDDRNNQLRKSKKPSGEIQSEFQLKKKSGELIWVKDNSRLLFDKEGNPEYFDGILEDITERKCSEIALKESEANLKAVIENTLESIWSVDRNYVIQYVNEVFVNAFMNAFGVRLAPGVKIVDCVPEEMKQVWIDRYERTFRNEHFILEDKIEAGDTAFYVEIAMNPIVVDGKVVGASIYGRDITEKKHAEIQLQYMSDLRQLIVDLSAGFINLPIKDIESAINESLVKIGKFVGADRAFIFDYDLNLKTITLTFEWCNEGIKPVIESRRQYNVNAFPEYFKTLNKGRIVIVDDTKELPEDSLRKILGEEKVISMVTIPLISEGEYTGFVGFTSMKQKHVFTELEQQILQVYAQTIINVKERVKNEQSLISAKEKAEESDRLKSSFLANMSHEIRTPMNGILGFLDLLKEPDLSEENKTTYIDIVTQSGNRLLETINDIIEISKIETGELKVSISTVNISDIMNYFHGFFSQQTDQKGLNYIISNKLPENIKSCQTDRIKLESIISNLIKNAIKYTAEGSIEFGCGLEKDNLIFYVKDTGIGIHSDRMNNIFERFVQGDTSLSHPQEGSGLGLSIVKAYVEMLKGEIRVESEQGKGSTFTFSIPYLPGKKDVKTTKLNNTIKKKPVKETRILIAEDDYASYLYLKKSLSATGITFLHTVTGADTIKAVNENPDISLIMMDIRFPDMSGLDAIKQIRKSNKKIPIIAQTAYALGGDKEKAIKAGCNDYISKPVSRTDLEKIVNKYTRSNKR